MSFMRNCSRSSLLDICREHTKKLYASLGTSCHRLEAVEIGASARLFKRFTQDDVDHFALLTGDTNHLHGASAERPIVHGVLTLGLLSALMGTQLPGPGSKVVELNVKFVAPLHVGEHVQASVQVSLIQRRLITLALNCRSEDSGKDVITGTARLLMPKHETVNP